MVMINHPRKAFGMDGYLVSNLTIAKDVIKKDWDFVFLVDGAERSGKSVLASQMAYFCDNSIDLSRITFTALEFKNAVLQAKPFQAVVYDEAYTGLSSKDTMGKINKALVEMLAEIGQKNLFIFVVMPTFFDLTKYVALWRSRALIHVYTGDNFERGYFTFYNVDRKKELFLRGKKLYDYRPMVATPNFYGRFPNFYVVDELAYREKKRLSLLNKSDNKNEIELQSHLEWLFNWLQDFPEMPEVLKQKVLKMPESTYFLKKRHLKALQDNVSPEILPLATSNKQKILTSE